MKRIIYKYQLSIKDYQEILLPKDSEILTIQLQGENACMWVLIDLNEPERFARKIEIFGTGQIINYDMGVDRKYISTFQMHGGQLVFHAFEYTGV